MSVLDNRHFRLKPMQKYSQTLCTGLKPGETDSFQYLKNLETERLNDSAFIGDNHLPSTLVGGVKRIATNNGL